MLSPYDETRLGPAQRRNPQTNGRSAGMFPNRNQLAPKTCNASAAATVLAIRRKTRRAG
jgi:hypothetical protein